MGDKAPVEEKLPQNAREKADGGEKHRKEDHMIGAAHIPEDARGEAEYAPPQAAVEQTRRGHSRRDEHGLHAEYLYMGQHEILQYEQRREEQRVQGRVPQL